MSLLRSATQVAVFDLASLFVDARKKGGWVVKCCVASKNLPRLRYETRRLGKDDSYDDCGPRITRNMAAQAGFLYYYYY